ALGPGSHEPKAAEQSKLMRDGRLRQGQDRRQVADAEFAVRKDVEKPDAGGVAERAEGLGQSGNGVGAHERSSQAAYPGEVDPNHRALIVLIGHMSRYSYVTTRLPAWPRSSVEQVGTRLATARAA